jgi:hypothetical protein
LMALQKKRAQKRSLPVEGARNRAYGPLNAEAGQDQSRKLQRRSFLARASVRCSG